MATIKTFSDRLIIIDKIHNVMTDTVKVGGKTMKQTYVHIADLINNITNSRIVYMCATPISNEWREII